MCNKRDKVIHLRVSINERNMLRKLAEAEHMNVSEYLRMLASKQFQQIQNYN